MDGIKNIVILLLLGHVMHMPKSLWLYKQPVRRTGAQLVTNKASSSMLKCRVNLKTNGRLN